VLKAGILHLQPPPTFNYNHVNCEKASDFFSSIKKSGLRFALESRSTKPPNSMFKKLLEDHNLIHCVDMLKESEHVYKSDILYTRLFGKGFHNIYQPLDSELKQVDLTVSNERNKKAVITMHSNRMFKDAGRFKIYKETGQFPKVTKSIGVDSLAEVMKDDAIFPSSKKKLVNHQGWKIIDLTPTKRIHASFILQKLPEKTYNGIQDIVEVLGDKKS